MRLTKKLIDGITAPPPKTQAFYRDDGLRGFGLKVTTGAKTFFVEKNIHGRSRRFCIGRFGTLTLEQARALAQEKMVEIARGRDPIAEKRESSRRAPTFGYLVDLYRARHLPLKKSRIDDEGMLTNHLAFLRPRTLHSITRSDLIALHTKIGTEPSTVVRPGYRTARRAPRLANKVLALLHSLFNLANDWGLYTGANPATRIKPFPQVSRDRYVSAGELPRLGAALAEEPSPFIRVAFTMALLTGARRDEVITAKWDDLDFIQGTWHIPETKNGRAHLLPLPRPLLALLAALPRFPDNPFVFPGRRHGQHVVNISAPWRRIRKAARLTDVRFHDLRRTCGSWLVNAGASLPVIGRLLNHSRTETTAVYARLQVEPVRLALEANAQAMLAVMKVPHAD